MGKGKGSSLMSRAASGSPASDYLIPGENVKWQGKPSAIIMGMGLLLTPFALVYLVLMELFRNSSTTATMTSWSSPSPPRPAC